MNTNTNTGLKKLLKNKNYLYYWFSLSFSMMASNILQFVLALYVFNFTGSGAVFASILSIIIIPRVIFTPFAGIAGDRFNRLKLMTVYSLIASVVLFLFVVISFSNYGLRLWHIYILVVVLEIIEVFYQAASEALLPEIAAKELLEEAASMSKLYQGIVFTATPMLSAFVYRFFDVKGGLLAAAVLFFAVTIFQMNIRYVFNKSAYKKDKWLKIDAFKEGIQEIKRDYTVRKIVMISPILNFFFAPVFTVAVAYLFLEDYKVGEYIYGLYNTIAASMSLIIPLVIVSFVKKYKTEKILLFSTFSVAVSLLVIALAVFLENYLFTGQYMIVVFLIILIDCYIVASVMPMHMSIQVLYHKTIDEKLRSRALSIIRMLTFVSIPLGQLFFGMMVDYFPVYVSLFVSSTGVFAVYFLYAVTFKKLK